MEVSWRFAGEITVLDLAGAFAVSSEDTEIESLRSDDREPVFMTVKPQDVDELRSPA
jgi:hypothetical protein